MNTHVFLVILKVMWPEAIQWQTDQQVMPLFTLHAGFRLILRLGSYKHRRVFDNRLIAVFQYSTELKIRILTEHSLKKHPQRVKKF